MLQLSAFLRLDTNPFVDKVRIKAVIQRDTGNRRAGLGALLDDLGFEGFGVRTTLWLHGKPA
jgi:hypothetical protein